MQLPNNKVYQTITKIIIVILCILFFSVTITMLISLMYIIISSAIKKYQTRRKACQLEQALPDFLNILGDALASGYTLSQSLEYTLNEVDEPLSKDLQKTHILIKNGVRIEDALLELKNYIQNHHMNWIIDSIILQIQVGGDIAQLLKEIAKLLNERKEQENELKSLTAQGRYSGLIVALLGPISIILFYIMAPDYISPLFTESLGRLMLVCAMFLNIIGFKSIWKLTHFS